MNLISELRRQPRLRQQVFMLLALLIVLGYASIIFGGTVWLIALVSIVSSILVEFGFFKTRKLPLTLSIIITPLIYVLLLPPTIPLWMAVVGSVFGTFFGKSLFGGEGAYIFPPAAVGVLFLIITFPAELNTMWLHPSTGQIQTYTAVSSLPFNPFPLSVNELLLGFSAGAIGETVRLAIMVLGVLLMLLRTIDYKITLSFLISIVVVQVIMNVFAGPFDPFYSLITGTVLFASVFLITDETVAPKNTWAKLLYGLGLAIITIIIRMFAAFPEGVIFAVIIMSAISPMLDSLFTKEKSV
ncbi:RnfABCDGE type electron transport complex subunit D [Candidatus Xianfuyuplasma coldseepsis]|uniref:RnfABCDGE type electron transport complex subunit D n=1 Tax=Candidatus Xianfuyuplasma coldseepsis TaxID=2782163 RepID=A0A7L7KRK6_9MOLU|nr:RnfABCDGE type electron transport complex subunit D [Xianfuyuplasma coldseepsis]QMS85460.1 RnfABCDGE type electron transport complex subunit D [Xianfuyuplasma coldseepsis]